MNTKLLFFMLLATSTIVSLRAAAPGQLRETATQVREAVTEGEIDLLNYLIEEAQGNFSREQCLNIINQRDAQEKTLLHIAAAKGRTPIVKALLKAGADADLRDNNGKTAYDLAKANRHDTIAELLLGYMANTKKSIHEAAAKRDLQAVKDSIAEAKKRGINIVNQKDARGLTPLHHAVKNNDYTMVTYLLEQKAEPYVVDGNGRTPLHYAALYFTDKYPGRDIVKALLDHGANTNMKDYAGQTAYAIAKESCWDTKFVDLLRPQ